MSLSAEAAILYPKIDMHTHVWLMPEWEKSADHLVHCGRMLGITEVWSSSIIAGGVIGSPDEVREHNDTTLGAMARHPDFIRGWCYLIPGHVSEVIAEAERCLDAGMVGIKLYNQYRINDPVVRPVIELAVDRRIPILEHAGYPVPEHMAAQPLISYGEHFTDVSERYPDAMLIHAHIGGGGDWEHTVRQMRGASPNVYIDVSGSNLDDGQVEFAVAELGQERVLFGTDGTMAGSVGKVLDADLTEEQRHLIFWGNAERILAAQGASPLHPGPSRGERQAEGGKSASSTSPLNASTNTSAHRPPPAAGREDGRRVPLFDVNAWLGSFPFRALRDNTPETLLRRMDRNGITAAAVAWIDACFHRCPQPGNERLAELVAPHRDRFVPTAVINPAFPAWQDDLARCIDDLGFRGVRIIPQYQGYPADGPLAVAVARACAERGVPLILPHRLEDSRQHHGIDPGKTVELSAAANLVSAVPEASIVIPNARGISRSALWQRKELRGADWYVDLSLCEIFYGLHRSVDVMRDLADMLDEGGASHLLFGTHLPFSYAGPALVKRSILPVDEDACLDISYRAAERILGISLDASGHLQT